MFDTYQTRAGCGFVRCRGGVDDYPDKVNVLMTILKMGSWKMAAVTSRTRGYGAR